MSVSAYTAYCIPRYVGPRRFRASTPRNIQYTRVFFFFQSSPERSIDVHPVQGEDVRSVVYNCLEEGQELDLLPPAKWNRTKPGASKPHWGQRRKSRVSWPPAGGAGAKPSRGTVLL